MNEFNSAKELGQEYLNAFLEKIEGSAEKFDIPERVQKNAQRGLELHKKFGRGGTPVGMNTARILSAGGSIGIEKVRHIAKYFPRHAGDNLSDKTSNGWIAWLLWGGDAGWSWSRGIVKRIDARSKESARNFTTEKRQKLADENKAMPDGSYPIVTIGDLKNAIQAFGRAKDPEAVKKHIIKRAKSLNASDLLPKEWTKEKAGAPSNMYDIWGDHHPKLNYRQIAMYGTLRSMVDDFGMFDQGSYGDGAHYFEDNPFADQGIKCENCAFYDGNNQCEIVCGSINKNAVCKLWIIPEDSLNVSPNGGQEDDATGANH